MNDPKTEAVDFRVMELIVSRLCHDLVSPVGAVNNGVELIDELGNDVLDDAMGLISQSARIASARLGLFRLAYGLAGSGSQVRWNDLRAAANAYIADGRANLDWPPHSVPSDDACPILLRYAGKLLLNMILLAEEAMPSGGRIVVTSDDTHILVTATGRAARLTDELESALFRRGPVDNLTARSIHAYVVGHYAAQANMAVNHVKVATTLADGSAGEQLSLSATRL
jgi:histidine phosphotransferase ChpT